MTLRLAMWSGPRNISTAMMRAWENRTDCTVVDEPFYACFLHASGLDHPMRDEVIASQSSDWQEVATSLLASPNPVFYQKHMTHHMLPDVDLSWANQLQHCFLIRNPYEVVASYAQKRSTVTTDDIGIVRQLELYEELTTISGQQIPIIEGKTVLQNPEQALTLLCQHFGIKFQENMLSWPAGRRSSDGVWAEHWYQAVEQSTGFGTYQPREIELDQEQTAIAEASTPAYLTLRESPHCITI